MPGTLSVELQEVPSEKLRADVVGVLKSWFPAIDTFLANRRLGRGTSVLVNGIDEDSASRIVDALKTMKVGARATAGDSWTKNLFNGGLIVSALALVMAPLVHPVTAIVLILVALGAPIGGAFLKRNRRRPLVSGTASRAGSESTKRLSKEYSDVIAALGPIEADSLRSIAGNVFEVLGRLSSGSLAAAAAGEDKGDLYHQLYDTLRAAVELGRKMSAGTKEDHETVAQELDSLRNLAEETSEWFRSLEEGDVRETPALTGDLQRIRESVDTIVSEVRGLQSPSRGKEDVRLKQT